MPIFLGYPIAGTTQHFMVTYAAEDDADALSRANAILGTCEADLATLETWFRCDFDKAAYSVWVHVAHGVPGGGADNFGYENNESSRIVITGTYQSSQSGPYDIYDEFPRMLFVAEMAEILMDFTGYGWGRGASAGEALSRIAAAELHPGAYYASGAGGGPYVNGWLHANPRPDWVSTTEGTDQDAISYGCGILFINYLVYQLGYPLSALVPAGGTNLSETFARLTGQGEANAFPGFEALLEQHLPVGETFNVPYDNVFPLWAPASRAVLFTVNESTLSSVQQPENLSFDIPEGCMAGLYTYQIENVMTEVDVEGHAWGYADPAFTWSINGTPLTEHDGQIHAVNVDVTITNVTPLPGDVPFNYSLPVQYIIVDGQITSSLKFANQAFPGNCYLDIGCGATEALVGGDPVTTQVQSWPLSMRSYDLSPAYEAKLFHCNPPAVWEISSAVTAIVDQIFVLLNTPDPAPDQIVALAAQTQRYLIGLQELTGGSIGLRGAAQAITKLARASVVGPQYANLAGVAGGLSVRVRQLPGGAITGANVDRATDAATPGVAFRPQSS